MSDWLSHIVGFGIIAALLGVVRFFPRSEWTHVLLTSYGVRPSGADGSFQRRDHFRASLFASLVMLLLLALSFGAFIWMESFANNSRANWTLAAAGFALFLLASMSGVIAGLAAWNGLRDKR